MWNMCYLTRELGHYEFDFIENSSGDTLFEEIGGNVIDAGVSVYQLISVISVYASGLAVLVSAVLLIINSTSGGNKLAEAKSYMIRVLWISIFLFGVSGIVSLVLSAGF